MVDIFRILDIVILDDPLSFRGLRAPSLYIATLKVIPNCM